jgi:hypothetical protein
MDERRSGGDGPTTPPVDAEEERRRLLDDAAAAGVDGEEALEAAARVAHGAPEADAYRAVDRRIATGHTVEEAEAVVQGDDPTGAGTAGEDRG